MKWITNLSSIANRVNEVRSPGAGLRLILVGAGILLASCTASDLPTPTRVPSSTPRASNVPQPTATMPTPLPTTVEPAERPTPSPFEGELFFPEDLNAGVEPVQYVQDRCEYLRLRWDPDRSPPGTIVAPIMFHTVRKSGRPLIDDTSITEEYFDAVLGHARELGFETITTTELDAFLRSNARIPPRTMILILDDRRPGVTERFLPYLVKNDWTLTLAWIIEDQRDYLWNWMEFLAEGGRLDFQSHGYRHEYIVKETSEQIIREELFSPIPIQMGHFGYRPTAYIWPGGNFTNRSVELARDAGYKNGFTANPQGPLMFNWIPQGEAEREIGDPLMTLPRFWSTVAWVSLDETVSIAAQAAAHARAQYPLEAAWYNAACDAILPPLAD